jgi:hypothetical protein
MLRKNPFIASAVAPLLPYAILAGVLYFYGKDIWAFVGSKITGISAEKLKADASTVAKAVSAPVETASDIIKAVTSKYISPAQQAAAIAEIKKTISTKAVSLPFPVPKSNAEFRANIEAIAKAKGFKK